MKRPAPARRLTAVWAGKATRRAVRLLGSGGTALPGLVAERVQPGAARGLARDLDAAALVTGTNGKTTTSTMLARILRRDGRDVVHNRDGSNLVRGVLAALIDASAANGRLRPRQTAVLESDEAALPAIADLVRPSVVVFTNLMRDQLDRYGEIEAIAGRWREMLAALSEETTIALNVDDPLIASLASAARGPVIGFGIEDGDAAEARETEIVDALWDPQTEADFRYRRRFYAHLGHWYTEAGGERPQPQLAAREIAEADGGLRWRWQTQDGYDVPVTLPAQGLYNVYNALAAAAAATGLGVAPQTVANALGEHQAAFGRQEELVVDGRPVQILLGKNPSGMNSALRTLQRAGERRHLLVLLNDGVADGEDVSWIWDTDWESQAPHCASLTLGGRRAADMALRLEYAGFPPPREPIRNRVADALRQALDALDNEPVDEPLVVLPTYTALLEVRKLLGELSGGRRLWEAS